ncbi:LuxR C-terminal-related transcriptional regulator [Streptomyces sp. NPDC099050]|uniref:response regulator transcription factor n=1 Tax=Streptomyces sp. NPDC099050 TaxID=3366100 RepID=UPI00383084EC
MDLRMPVMDGTETTRRLCEQYPQVAVVVLTTFADEDSILGALGAGARGYLTKNAGRKDITRAIRAAAAGQSVLDREVQDRLLATVRNTGTATATATATTSTTTANGPVPGSDLPEDLTRREREVLALIGQGLPNREIAEKLFISEATLKTHINNLFAKAGIPDRAAAVRRAIEAGLA